MIADAYNEGRHVDKNIRQIVSETLLDHLRDTNRNIQDAGHHRIRFVARKCNFTFLILEGILTEVVCYLYSL